MFFLTSDFKGLKNWNAKLGVPHWPIAKSDFFPRKTFRWPSLIFLPFGASCHFFQLSGNFFILLLAASKSWSSNINKKNCPYDQNHLSLSLCNTALVGWSRLLSQLRRNVTLVASIVRSLSRSIEDHLEKVPGNRENEKKFKSLRYLRFLTISYYRLPCRAWAARALPGWA